MYWLEHTGGQIVHDQAVVAQRFARKSAIATGGSHCRIKTLGDIGGDASGDLGCDQGSWTVTQPQGPGDASGDLGCDQGTWCSATAPARGDASGDLGCDQGNVNRFKDIVEGDAGGDLGCDQGA